MKYNLQDVISADRKTAGKMLFPEVYSNYRAKTFSCPGIDEVESLTDHIQNAKLNTKFKFSLVGSILNPKVDSKDIDIVITKKKEAVSMTELEQAMIKIRLFGLQELYCDIDMYYLSISQNLLKRKISEQKQFYLWQLIRPGQEYFISANSIKFRTFGKMIVIERKPELEFSHDKTITLDPQTGNLPNSKSLF